ncbi:MAG TPA: polysaccharide deacetylase family protein [Gemmataceae bacterium]|jgi:peptidoglycan/xylan/chitin deacetylase (PgdA/CDA1 family)|nr:polysaccharide deacetylase family protein [Gemmataceae bacterium]
MRTHFPGVILLVLSAVPALTREPVPDKLAVLTFDDASKSHYTVARPLLKKYSFGATFFVTEGFDFPTNKRDYMTWEQIAQLHKDGFEIGNHTLDHKSVTRDGLRDLAAQVRGINSRCKEHGIPVPVSFAYPGNAIERGALPVLRDLGIRFARRGGSPERPYKEGNGFAYEPGLDHPLLIPSAGDARPGWTLDDFKRAVGQAREGKVAVLQFHGVPDSAHDWVTTSRRQFEEYLKYLADNKFRVIALRDLAKYVDPDVTPADPWGVIKDRQHLLEKKAGRSNARPATTDADLRYWLENMAVHRFALPEMGAALGLTTDEVSAALRRFDVDPARVPRRAPDAPLLVLPYPGGRHPRVGFLDGAIRPRRETKVSVFAPWKGGGYAVADVPEAIWFEPGGKRELLYLAHTHVPTVWDKQGVSLDALEWKRNADGSLEVERRLPNKVAFGAKVVAGRDGVRMELWVRNGSQEKLTGLRVQMCVMLKGLSGFAGRTIDNKVFARPFAACHDPARRCWVITGWEPCVRAWGNPPCPCLHSDPQVPDCPPGETRRVRGWLSFYEGTDIDAELRRLRDLAFGKRSQ